MVSMPNGTKLLRGKTDALGEHVELAAWTIAIIEDDGSMTDAEDATPCKRGLPATIGSLENRSELAYIVSFAVHVSCGSSKIAATPSWRTVGRCPRAVRRVISRAGAGIFGAVATAILDDACARPCRDQCG